MRTIPFAIKGLLFWALLAGSCSPKTQSTTSDTASQVLQKVDERSFQFNMEFVQPSGGRQRNITGSYTLRVKPDLVEADLPYIGRAYQAPLGATDNGMKFSTKDFTYNSTTGKNDRREITIQPKDEKDVKEIFITVFNNGKADLRINSVNRQPISYTGNITSLP